MGLDFYKYQGAGNDFIMVDNRLLAFNHHNPQVIAALCHRRFGIGADGIMFLQNHADYDFEMIYYNADGNPSSMCGNGGRCIVAFAKHLSVIKNETTFLAVDGSHYAKISDDNQLISLQMNDVDTINFDGDASILDTGSPHYVIKQQNLANFDVFYEGKKIRNQLNYKEKGINVNFVEAEGEGYFVRTYERGVEDETFACGTGVTAVALAMAAKKNLKGHIKTPIRVLGGKLLITFNSNENTFTNIFLTGPAEMVFKGHFKLN